MIGLGVGIGLRRSAAPTEVPVTVSGLLAWYRADFIVPSAGPAATLTNRASSGTSNDFSQGTGGLQPATTTLGGKPALSFPDGKTLKCTNRFLGGLAACSFFIVHNSPNDAGANGGIFGGGNGAAIELIDLGAGTKRIRVNAATVTSSGWSASTDTVNTVIFDGSAAGGSATAYKNGSLLATASTLGATLTTPLSFHQIGAYFDTFYATTTVAELIVYNRALTASEQRMVEAYLGQRYGITVA